MNELIQLLVQSYPPDCQAERIEPLGSAGGMSGAQFWRIMTPRGILVLRRWPVEHPTPDRLRFIHAVVHHAAERGISFLPVPVVTRDGESFIAHAGHLWELAPWMPGTADYEISPSVPKLRAAMTALAQFHTAVANFESGNSPPLQGGARGGFAAIPRRLARLRELTPNRINELANYVDDTACSELAQLAHEFLTALPRAIPRAIAQLEPLANAQFPLQPCLRDIWHDHVLFTGDEVTGLVDFGALDIDTPTSDIARLLGSLVDATPLPFREGSGEGSALSGIWQTGLAAYSATRKLSQSESLAVVALNTANPIVAGCNWIRWVYIERRRFENPQQIIARFQRLNAELLV